MPIVPTAKFFQNDKYHAWLESVGVCFVSKSVR